MILTHPANKKKLINYRQNTNSKTFIAPCINLKTLSPCPSAEKLILHETDQRLHGVPIKGSQQFTGVHAENGGWMRSRSTYSARLLEGAWIISRIKITPDLSHAKGLQGLCLQQSTTRSDRCTFTTPCMHRQPEAMRGWASCSEWTLASRQSRGERWWRLRADFFFFFSPKNNHNVKSEACSESRTAEAQLLQPFKHVRALNATHNPFASYRSFQAPIGNSTMIVGRNPLGILRGRVYCVGMEKGKGKIEGSEKVPSKGCYKIVDPFCERGDKYEMVRGWCRTFLFFVGSALAESIFFHKTVYLIRFRVERCGNKLFASAFMCARNWI